MRNRDDVFFDTINQVWKRKDGGDPARTTKEDQERSRKAQEERVKRLRGGTGLSSTSAEMFRRSGSRPPAQEPPMDLLSSTSRKLLEQGGIIPPRSKPKKEDAEDGER